MKLQLILLFISVGFFATCHSQFSGMSLDSAKDVLKNMTDQEVFALLEDIILRNPSFTFIFHKLEAVPFSLGPLLSPPSLRNDILNNLLLWSLDRLPFWLQNPHFVNAFHVLVRNVNAVNVTGLSTTNPNDFVLGLLNRTDFVEIAKEILMSEGSNITSFTGMDPSLAKIVLPWTANKIGNFLKTDASALLKILVNELNAVNTTGLNQSDSTEFLKGIRMRFNYMSVLKRILNLQVAKDVLHGIYSIVGLKPEIGDKFIPIILDKFPDIVNATVAELNNVNLTTIFLEYGNISDANLIKSIDYVDMVVKYFVPNFAQLFANFMKDNAFDLLKIVAYEANKVPIFLVNIQFPNDPVKGFIHYFDFEDLFMRILQQKGDFVFHLLGLKPEIGKLLAPVITKDVPELLKITITELNKIDVATLQNATSSLDVLKKIDYTSLISTFATKKGLTMSDFFGIPLGVAAELLPWTVSHIENLTRRFGPDLFNIVVQEINDANLKDIETSTPDAFVADLMSRLNWKEISLKILSVVGKPLFDVLHINSKIGFKIAPLVIDNLPYLEAMATAILQNLSIPENTTLTLGSLLGAVDIQKILPAVEDPLLDILHVDNKLKDKLKPLLQDSIPFLLNTVSTLMQNVSFDNVSTNASAIMMLLNLKQNVLEVGKNVLQGLLNQFLLERDALGNPIKPPPSPGHSALKAPSPLAAETCGADASYFINQLFGGKNWALKMLDAAGKPPPGILTGNLHLIGSYDECVDAPHEDGADMPYETRYCRLAFDLPKSLVGSLVGDINLYGMKTTLSLGACLPNTCGKEDVSGFFTNNFFLRLLNIAPMSVYCSGTPDISQDKGAIITITIVAVIVVLVVIATLIHVIKWGKPSARYDAETSKQKSFTNGAYASSYDEEYPMKKSNLIPNGHEITDDGSADTKDKPSSQNDVMKQNGHIDISFSDDESSNTELSFEKGSEVHEETQLNGPHTKQPVHDEINSIDDLSSGGLGKQLVMAFSALRNLTDVMSFRRNPENIHCIHGIRFITMSWVILGTSYIFSILPVTDSAVASDLLHVIEVLKRFTFQAVMGATLGTDTFLMISGCLMAYVMLSKFENKGKVNWKALLGSFFHRYWRLTPPYMIILAILLTMYHYIGTGPHWPENIAVADDCQGNWWHHLLHINNLIGISGKNGVEQCMTWGWFVAVLMQFYLITPILIACILFSYRLGAVVISLLMIAGIVSAGIKENQYGGDILTMVEDGGAYWNNVFIAPWCRVSSYCVGLLLAMILLHWKDKNKKLHMAVAVIGWILSIAVAIFIVYISYTKYQDPSDKHPWTNAELAAYEALARPVWTVCVAWVIFSCFMGYGGYVDSFLSWEGFLPLSKLTYAAYIISPVWIVFQVYSKRTLIYLYSDYEMMYMFIGHLVMIYGASLLVSLAFELPFINLERALFKKK